MDPYEETFETWNKIARLYEDKFMDLDLYDETYDFFCGALSGERSRILEIGCGPGNITKYLLSKMPNLKIEGIDIAPEMIALAKVNNPSADFRLMDSRELDRLNQTFDAIMCGFCVPYLSAADCSKLLSDCANILIGNGILYLSFVAGDPSRSGFVSASSGDRVYFYYHSLDKLERQLWERGFEITKRFEVAYPKAGDFEIHTILIAKKNEELSA